MLAIVLAAVPAYAAAYYHPDDVAKASAVFNAAAERLGPAFDSRQSELARWGASLEELELGTALLGPACPEATRAWALETRKEVTAQFLLVQKHVDGIQDGYAQSFGDALARALPKVPGGASAVQCQAKGTGFGPSMSRSASCTGEDLNAAIAKVLDADPVLQQAVADLNGASWPELSAQPAPQPVVAITGEARWMNLGAVAKKLLPEVLRAERDSLEADLEEIQEALEARDPQALAKAQAQKDAYLAKLAASGATLRALIDEAVRAHEKKQGTRSVAYCANPPRLGGCAGEDATETVLAALRADAKFTKALDKAF
jgi:hypothetical protein